jgi:hypothetical protein
MTSSPEGPTANRSAKWEEVSQLGMPEQIGCPDTRPLGPTVAQLLKARKVTQATLAGFLAIVISDYKSFGGRVRDEYQGACNVPIPVEVIALIGEKLVGKARWSKEGRDARTETADKQHVKWQAKADAVWRKNKKLSLTAVAQRIAPNNWNYVRQVIRKPKK